MLVYSRTMHVFAHKLAEVGLFIIIQDRGFSPPARSTRMSQHLGNKQKSTCTSRRNDCSNRHGAQRLTPACCSDRSKEAGSPKSTRAAACANAACGTVAQRLGEQSTDALQSFDSCAAVPWPFAVGFFVNGSAQRARCDGAKAARRHPTRKPSDDRAKTPASRLRSPLLVDHKPNAHCHRPSKRRPRSEKILVCVVCIPTLGTPAGPSPGNLPPQHSLTPCPCSPRILNALAPMTSACVGSRELRCGSQAVKHFAVNPVEAVAGASLIGDAAVMQVKHIGASDRGRALRPREGSAIDSAVLPSQRQLRAQGTYTAHCVTTTTPSTRYVHHALRVFLSLPLGLLGSFLCLPLPQSRSPVLIGTLLAVGVMPKHVRPEQRRAGT